MTLNKVDREEFINSVKVLHGNLTSALRNQVETPSYKESSSASQPWFGATAVGKSVASEGNSILCLVRSPRHYVLNLVQLPVYKLPHN